MEEEDKIFIEMPIPRTLSEIGFLQAEKDIKAGKEGDGSALYAIVSGLKKDMSGAAQQPNILAGELNHNQGGDFGSAKSGKPGNFRIGL